MTTIDYHSDIEAFVERHGLTAENQFLCLIEEVGELGDAVRDEEDPFGIAYKTSINGSIAEKLLREGSDVDVDFETTETDALAEELADIVFVAETIAYLNGIDLSVETATVAAENLDKTTSTDGEKVTKDGLEEGQE